MATIIADEVRTVAATADGERLLVALDRLEEAIGWALKPQGLCRDEVCVPVRDGAALMRDGALDLGAVATALGRPAVIDAAAALAAVALDAEARLRALDRLEAPAFALSDLDGNVHRLDEWRGRKKLLVAFASW